MAGCSYELKVVEFLMSDSTMQLRGQAESVAGSIGSWAAATAVSGCTLYAVFWLLSFGAGSANGPILAFTKWYAKALFLIALAGSGSMYNQYVMSVFIDAPAEIAQLVASGGLSKGIQMDAEGRVQLGTALDQAASRGLCTGTAIWSKSSILDPADTVGYMIAGLVVILCVVVFVAVACGLVFVGYASLFIVLSLGPLFIICGIFEVTKSMFESFFRTALNNALYGVVLMVIIGLAIGLVDAFTQSDIVKGSDDSGLAAALSVGIRSLFAFAIAAALLMKADDISASLAGGISIGAGGALRAAMGTMTKPVAAATKGARALQKGGLGKAMGEFRGGEFHRDPRTGQTSYRSASEMRGQYSGALAAARAKNTIKK